MRPLLCFVILMVVSYPGTGSGATLPERRPKATFHLSGSAGPGTTEPGEAIATQPLIADSRAPQLTFGSQAILNSCWSPQELEGSPTDKRITRSTAGRPYPPDWRTLPKHTLKPLPVQLQNSIRSVKPAGNLKLVALTFDLCESAGETTGYDAEIVNCLRRNKVKATFFATGKWMLSHADKTMQLMADPLFEIGNHSGTHRNSRTLDSQRFSEEVLWTQAQYESLWEQLAAKPCATKVSPDEILKIPAVPLTFRFPFGTCNREALDFLARSGLPAIQWSVVTGDPAPGQSASAISREILQKTQPGTIIVCHANGRGYATPEALPLFVPNLLQLGYEFVTISELLAAGSASAAGECYEIKPGDNLRYDRRSGAGNR